jgi:hypothetical protein
MEGAWPWEVWQRHHLLDAVGFAGSGEVGFQLAIPGGSIKLGQSSPEFGDHWGGHRRGRRSAKAS